jgi:hypothetical protein
VKTSTPVKFRVPTGTSQTEETDHLYPEAIRRADAFVQRATRFPPDGIQTTDSNSKLNLGNRLNNKKYNKVSAARTGDQ